MITGDDLSGKSILWLFTAAAAVIGNIIHVYRLLDFWSSLYPSLVVVYCKDPVSCTAGLYSGTDISVFPLLPTFTSVLG